MKLLLAVTGVKDINALLSHYQVSLRAHTSLAFIQSGKILHHEIDFLETGAGVYQTAYKVTRALGAARYHLALKMSLGNAYKEETAVGTVLNIINEKPGDYGMMVNGEWMDHYDFNLLSRDAVPHVRGGFINMTNAYMNVFMPFKKAVGISVSNYADKTAVAMRKEKYKADCETGDGIGFTYPCLFEQQTFYHLCTVERNMISGEHNSETATTVMNEVLIDLMHKL